MLTIEDIKEECIAIDLANMEGGNSIGVWQGGTLIEFTDEKVTRMYYHDISLKVLLEIYSNYMGLSCLAQEEGLEKHGYVLDPMSVLKYLKR